MLLQHNIVVFSVRAMENIHKFVSDPEHKKMLREGDGIGTSATRASIIFELKRREFLETKGRQTYPDLKGRPDYSKGRNGPTE